jgi:hypothetical protein
MRVKPLDLAIVIAAALAVAWAAVSAYSPAGERALAVVTGKGGEWMYPLSADRTFRVAGPLGDTVVEIRDKALRITDSPCPNKTCIAAGAISKPGQWVACLPNQVIARIEGGRADNGVDATVY